MKEFTAIDSGLILSATDYFRIKDFYKEEKEGGMFYCITSSLFHWFEEEIKNSKKRELKRYKMKKQMRIRDIIEKASMYCILELVDLAHIKQICEKGFLSEHVSNYFFIYNKYGEICRISINKLEKGWSIHVEKSKDEYYIPSALMDLFTPICFLGNRKPSYPINYKED